MVDFDLMDEEASENEKRERRKELLRKLNKMKNSFATSHSSSLLSAKRLGIICPDQEESKSPGAEARQDPDLNDLEETLTQDCSSHPADQTKYYCNDCKVFICIQCIAFGNHGRPCQVSKEEESR